MFQVNSNIVLPTLVDVHQAEVGGLAVFSSLSPPPATFGPVMIRAVQNLQPFHETDFQVEPASVSEYAELISSRCCCTIRHFTALPYE